MSQHPDRDSTYDGFVDGFGQWVEGVTDVEELICHLRQQRSFVYNDGPVTKTIALLQARLEKLGFSDEQVEKMSQDQEERRAQAEIAAYYRNLQE